MSSTMNGAKPRLSVAQIINMSVGFLGIQFAFGLQNANVSRIFQTLGAKIEEIPILWIAAPLTGLIVQPIIGHMSDKTWMGKLGRRRPFFLAGAIFASLALVVFPGVDALWMAAVMLWLLDASRMTIPAISKVPSMISLARTPLIRISGTTMSISHRRRSSKV